jgi:probable F420-dependent oxidoreductase
MEIFVLFSYMAAVTQKIGLVTGILILPQRQTALVGKQAATLDVLSGGRLRLGVGLGWNTVEYQSLGQDFHTRGRRMEEQITLLRQLWTQPLVQFNGRWDTIPDAGIKPLPVQHPIPIWMGGSDERVLRRAARLADGWMPNYRTAADALPALHKLNQYLAESGRSREKFGLEARLPYGQGDLPALQAALDAWQQAGATHLTINTLGSGFHTPAEHLAALEKFAPLLHR